LLGILNSPIASFYLRSICPAKLGGYSRFNANNINNTPVRVIDFSNKADKARHDKMVSLVERMLKLHKDLPKARSAPDKTAIERQVAATDKQIDALVYELYGLTKEEIAVVEKEL
jgi:hypothetical protein